MAKLPKGTMKVEVVAITSGAQRGQLIRRAVSISVAWK